MAKVFFADTSVFPEKRKVYAAVFPVVEEMGVVTVVYGGRVFDDGDASFYLRCYGNPGDGESLFPVTAWFDNDTIPENVYVDTKNWDYDGKTIRIDFRKAE